MLRAIISLFIICISMPSISIEASVSGRSSSGASVSRVESKVSSLTTIIEVLGTELNNIRKCNEKKATYTPDDATADSDGCVAPLPHTQTLPLHAHLVLTAYNGMEDSGHVRR